MVSEMLLANIDELLHFVMPGDCFDEIFINLNLFHRKCTSLVLSRVLGLTITVCSFVLFLPQILKIQYAQSAHGLSLMSNLLALVASFSVAAYSFDSGFVFSQWGDSLFVTVQLVVVICQILWFSSHRAYAAVFVAFFWTITSALINNYISHGILVFLQASTIPIVIVSKFLQAHTNYIQKSTGQLSVITVALQFGGCLARVFTSAKETGDLLVIMSFTVATLMNGIIFSQIFIYWNTETKKKI